MGDARLAAVPHSPERFCGTAGFAVVLKRTALTEERGNPFLDPGTPCFLPLFSQNTSFLRAELVLRSVTTGESSVLYVFGPSFFFRLLPACTACG